MYKIHNSTMDSRGDTQGEKVVIVNVVKRDVNTGNSIFFSKNYLLFFCSRSESAKPAYFLVS